MALVVSKHLAVVSNNMTNVCHAGFVLILSPRAEASAVARSCFYCSLSQFNQHIVVAVPLCRGRQRKAVRPALLEGAGKFGGCLEQRGAHSLVQANRHRELLGTALCWRGTALPARFLLRSLQIITIIIKKKTSENSAVIFAFRLW